MSQEESHENNQSSETDENSEYIGNIWGWRASIYSAIFILLFIIFASGRYIYLVSTDQYPVKHDSTERESLIQDQSVTDSLKKKFEKKK